MHWYRIFHYFLQLVLCAIPAFFKVPGRGPTDLGGRTEGKHLHIITITTESFTSGYRICHKQASSTFLI